MNIFCLHKDPQIAAQMMCDKHVGGKMQTESAQLLASCFTLDRLAQPDCPRSQSGQPRKHSHFNHPCSIWTRATTANMQWLVDHALALCDEYTLRYGKRHFCQDFIEWCDAHICQSTVSFGELTEFAIAINDAMNCRSVPNFVDLDRISQYRLYYLMDKPFAKWEKGRPAPEWFAQEKAA